MAIASGHGAGGLNVDINVTPLIDVLLVLLITFMVIVPVPPRGLDAKIPQNSKSPNNNPDTAVVLQIVRTHTGQVSYRINQDSIALAELGGRLRTILSVRSSKVMFVKGDSGLDFSTVAQVLDIAKVAGADDIGLITPKNGM